MKGFLVGLIQKQNKKMDAFNTYRSMLNMFGFCKNNRISSIKASRNN